MMEEQVTTRPDIEDEDELYYATEYSVVLDKYTDLLEQFIYNNTDNSFKRNEEVEAVYQEIIKKFKK